MKPNGPNQCEKGESNLTNLTPLTTAAPTIACKWCIDNPNILPSIILSLLIVGLAYNNGGACILWDGVSDVVNAGIGGYAIYNGAYGVFNGSGYISGYSSIYWKLNVGLVY